MFANVTRGRRLRSATAKANTGSAKPPWASSERCSPIGLTIPLKPFADRLVPHGCGAILMMGCGIGIDWTVTHLDGRVRIAHVVRYDTNNEVEAVRFPGLAVEISVDAYKAEIVAFARRAKEPFEGIQKSFSDDVERKDYLDFCEEYEQLLN